MDAPDCFDTRYMATVNTAYADETAVDPEELRASLRQADPGVLVAVLAQLTGDPSVVDTFGPKISHVPDPPERAGVTDPATAEALVNAVMAALGGGGPPRRRPPMTPNCSGACYRWRSAPTSTTSSFRCCSSRAASSSRSRHCRPRCRSPKRRTWPSSARASPASPPRCRRRRRCRLRDLRTQRRGRWYLVDHHLPRHRRGHPLGVLLVVARGESGMDELLSAGRGIPGLPDSAGRQVQAARAHPIPHRGPGPVVGRGSPAVADPFS